MPRGISLHVGLNFTKVGGTPLLGCVNDAIQMAAIAKKHGFEGREILADDKALLQSVMDRIKAIATQLVAGDIFLFTFSGHGSFIGDQNGDEPNDFRDETLVLYDYMLIDDVLARDLWPKFAGGVRILMIADSCYSGTVVQRIVGPQDDRRRERERERDGEHENSAAEERTISNLAERELRDSKSGTPKMISEADRRRHLETNRAVYEKILRDLPAEVTIGASVLQFGACDDNGTTADGFPNCVFTQALLDVLKRQSPPTSYPDLLTQLRNVLVATQVPQLTPAGVKNPAFEAEAPFTI